MNNYQKQASDFLTKNGITLTVTKAVPQTCPDWQKCEPFKFYPVAGKKSYAIYSHNHGFEYSIELKRAGIGKPLVFPFWTSIHDTYIKAAKTALRYDSFARIDSPLGAIAPGAYDILAGMSNDSNVHSMHFDEWCDEYGYSNDSIQAKAIYDYSCKFSRDISRFFTPTELEELSEIQ